MITPQLEKWLLSGMANINRTTLFGSSQYILAAPINRTAIITKIDINPMISLPIDIGITNANDEEITDVFFNSSGFITDTEIDTLLRGVLERIFVQLQIRTSNGNYFISIKPEFSLGTTNLEVSSGVFKSRLNTTMIFKRISTDVFIIYDKDTYIDLVVLGDTDLFRSNPGFNETAPVSGGITEINTGNTNTQYVKKQTDKGIYIPSDSKYLNLSLSPSALEQIETNFQVYGDNPVVITDYGAGQPIKYTSKFVFPCIDIEIVSLNEKSLLKSIK